MRKILPLSEIEKHEAEVNHGWVYKFLHEHDYSIEELYDVAIIGYLSAIQDYHRKPHYKDKYKLSTLCGCRMQNEVMDYYRALRRPKRNPDGGIFSLDVEKFDDGEDYYNIHGVQSFEDDLIELEAISQMLNVLSEHQQQIVHKLMDGYKPREIYKSLKIKEGKYYRELQAIKDILLPLLTSRSGY